MRAERAPKPATAPARPGKHSQPPYPGGGAREGGGGGGQRSILILKRT